MKKDSKQISPERLIEENMELAKSLAWEFLKRVPVEKRDWVKDDVFSAAYIGLTIAAGKYKAEFGTKFSTYAYSWIAGEIKVVGHTPVREVLEQDNMITVDTFSTSSDGRYIGNKEFCWVDTVMKEWGYF